MSTIKNITMIVALVLCAMSTQAQNQSSQAKAAAINETAQAEIDHLYFFIGGARRCHLLTASGMQDGMKTIVEFKELYQQQAGKINSTEDFIALVATNSASTGKANIVECRNNGEKVKVPMSFWLETELASYRTGG
jgi:hypothetical protein